MFIKILFLSACCICVSGVLRLKPNCIREQHPDTKTSSLYPGATPGYKKPAACIREQHPEKKNQQLVSGSSTRRQKNQQLVSGSSTRRQKTSSNNQFCWTCSAPHSRQYETIILILLLFWGPHGPHIMYEFIFGVQCPPDCCWISDTQARHNNCKTGFPSKRDTFEDSEQILYLMNSLSLWL